MVSFRKTSDLDRSILDIDSFNVQKKLPLLYDILDRACKATDAEYIVYTNMDIILMPQFYLAVDSYIRNGFDAMVINRRDIEPTSDNPLQNLIPGANAGYEEEGDQVT